MLSFISTRKLYTLIIIDKEVSLFFFFFTYLLYDKNAVVFSEINFLQILHTPFVTNPEIIYESRGLNMKPKAFSSDE